MAMSQFESGYDVVTRGEYEALERKVQNVEQSLRSSEANLRLLQARVDSMSMVGGSVGLANGFASAIRPMPQLGGLGARDRSRSPMPVALSQPQGPSLSVEAFIEQNALDDKCVEVLMNQPHEIQQYVIGMGPADGRNPSAMVMGRCAAAGGGARQASPATLSLMSQVIPPKPFMGGMTNLDPNSVEEFIATNGLDEKCAENLRTQAPDIQAAVVGMGPAVGRNPSAMVSGRIVKAQRGEI